tara:strand:- start:4300 stop:4539 length:240 start_codon:yes stop_codon:yes gene_type:complete
MGIANLAEVMASEGIKEYAQSSGGSLVKKAPVKAKGNRWHPGKKRKQTRTLVKPRKPRTKTLMSGNKYNYEKYVGRNSQ